MSSFGINGHTGKAGPDPMPTVAALSQGLHQTAQPLTVLQCLLEQALLDPCTAEQYREVIARAMSEARRVTECLDHVFKLVHRPEVSPTSPNVEIGLSPGTAGDQPGSLPGEHLHV
jgi:hypothetical protein